MDQNPDGDQNLKGDTISFSYPCSTTEGDGGVPSSSLPTSPWNALPLATLGATVRQMNKSLSTPLSLPTVVEPPTSRTTSPDLPHSATTLSVPTHSRPAATSGDHGTSSSGEIHKQAQQTRTPASADHPPASGRPLEWDYVDLESASGPGVAAGGRGGTRQGLAQTKPHSFLESPACVINAQHKKMTLIVTKVMYIKARKI